MKSNWNFPCPTQSRSANRQIEISEINVLPRLQDGCDRAAAGVGHGVSARALSADVLLQLLVGLAAADHRAFVESRELQRVVSENRLLADPAALHVDCRAGHAVLSAARVSGSVLLIVLFG